MIDVAVGHGPPGAADARIDQADGLVRRTSAGTGDTRRTDGQIRPIQAPAAIGHFGRRLGTDSRIRFQRIMRNAEYLFFHLITVRPGRTAEIIGSARDIGDERTDESARTRFGSTDGIAALTDVVGRDGAKDTDLVCVTGNLGAAYLGLQLLEREKAIYLDQLRQQPKGTPMPFEPDFAGKEYLLERILKPEARRDVWEALRKAGIRPTAMIDVSDGLSSELLHICKASGCGCRIFEERIPIDFQTASTAEDFNLNVYTCALNGGEDYALLFTVPLADHERVATACHRQMGEVVLQASYAEAARLADAHHTGLY